ncbi:hypothetical protein [Streptomyces himastatinicus]|uniref:hypothetical protein n=1 Tax=Streptomyces himastatinicus TaxID=998084 RepID=UPI0012B6810D|nr:hypothetical protein [Streptomyces himastatinicus]
MTDHPDELTLATDLLSGQGWAVRAPEGQELVTVGPRRRPLIIEVRLRGAPQRARKAAVRQVEHIAAGARLGLWVRHSQLLRPERERRTEYVVIPKPPTDGRPFARWLLRLTWRLDGSHGRQAVSLPGPPNRAAALAEMGRYDMGGGRFDPAVSALHGPPDPPDDAEDEPDPSTPAADRHLSLALVVARHLAAWLICVLSGGVLRSVDSHWGLAALLPPLALALPLGNLFGRSVRSRWRRLGLGLALAYAGSYSGYLLMAVFPLGVGELLLFSLVGFPLAVTLLVGVWYALVPSWFSRNASWFVPLLALPLPVVLPWFGTLLYTVYLTYGFHIPFDATPVTKYSLIYAAFKPVALASGFALVALGIAGWARHLHWRERSGDLPTFLLPIVAVQYVVTALAFGILGAGSAMMNAADAVRDGHTPAGYYGLRGKLMCVRPLSDDIAVYNGPLPRRRAVLTFGSTGDRIWLWGPQPTKDGAEVWTSMSVRLEDVALTAPRASGSTCATGAGGPQPSSTPVP